MNAVKRFSLDFFSYLWRYFVVLLANNFIPAAFGVCVALSIAISVGMPVPSYFFILLMIFMAAAASAFVRNVVSILFPFVTQYTDDLKRVVDSE